jgi:two-component system OmpR family sensor kinase
MKLSLSMSWRIFLGLWLGSTLLMIGSSLLIAVIAQREVPIQVRERVQMLLQSSARSALMLHGRVDPDEFAASVRTLESDYGVRLYFVGEDGRELLGRMLPERMKTVDESLNSNAEIMQFDGVPPIPKLAYGESMLDSKGHRFRVLMAVEGPPMPTLGFILGNLVLPLLFSILIAGFFSAISARYLVKPIEHLRLATRRFASGDLQHRVGAALQRRNDEFSALAGDFDRMADRIGELIGAQRRLMLDLSHELRSPLARLRVALELQRGPQPRPELLDRMERDVDRMDVLIGELLLLARLQSAESELPRAPVDLAELVADIIEDARLEIDGQRRSLSHDPAAAAISVEGDRELLRRAIENVVRNALQHTPEDADVEVALLEVGGQAAIRVIDGGGGFAADMRERLFAPFARGDDVRQGPGYGLGLAIARAAVRRHGGDIGIAERHGPDGAVVGAIVEIRLPLAAVAAPVARRTSA